jgi:hypothetical protein
MLADARSTSSSWPPQRNPFRGRPPDPRSRQERRRGQAHVHHLRRNRPADALGRGPRRSSSSRFITAAGTATSRQFRNYCMKALWAAWSTLNPASTAGVPTPTGASGRKTHPRAAASCSISEPISPTRPWPSSASPRRSPPRSSRARLGAGVQRFLHRAPALPGLTVVTRRQLPLLAPRPRFHLRGTKGNYWKWGLDPQEAALNKITRIDDRPGDRNRPPIGARFSVDVDGGMVTRPVEPIPGDYRLYYAAVRDALLGKAPAPVPPSTPGAWPACSNGPRKAPTSAAKSPATGAARNRSSNRVPLLPGTVEFLQAIAAQASPAPSPPAAPRSGSWLPCPGTLEPQSPAVRGQNGARNRQPHPRSLALNAAPRLPR